MKASTPVFFFAVLAAVHAAAFAQDKPDMVPNYRVSDIDFTAHDQVTMFGRLVLPKTGRPRAIVVAVQTAEGATVDMKRPLGKGKTFNYYDVYRKHLTDKNIGFFSYEGRGIRMGDKPPRYETIDRAIYDTSTLDNKVRDVVTAIQTIRKQEGLQETPILLLGASEGTLIAAEAASRAPESVAGLVLYGVLATNLRQNFRYIMSGGEYLRYRSFDTDKDGRITKEEWTAKIKNVDFTKADLNKDGVFTVADIEVATKKYIDAIDNDDYAVLQAWAKTSAAVAVPKDWFKDHFTHADNWQFLSKLDIPVGCFHGGLDRMTPIGAVKELEAKAKAAKLTKMEFHYFDELDHSLGVGKYFVNGQLPEGHQAIFEFVDRVVPPI